METQAQLEQAVPGFLNERSVSLLESRWADLRHEAYAESLESGFRIHLLGPSQAFVEAGFRDNDVVASNELLRYAKTVNKKALVERLLAILDHIKK